MSKKSIWVGAVSRAVGVISAVVVLMTGVTYAALQSPQATLTNSTISSATADLRIGTSATSFASTRIGFNFVDLIPGGLAAPVDGNIFYLKNYGNAKLGLHISIGSIPVNLSNVDLTKVSFVMTRLDTSTVQTFTVKTLVDSYINGGLSLTDSLSGSVVAEYKLQAIMSADAFTGQNAQISDLDLVFTGTGTN
ncbi:MAG: hypothetical protein WCJ86_02655 [Candidatus Saccharibacteria bacterium]